jgi:membrane-bound lytic murein transglycosylase D
VRGRYHVVRRGETLSTIARRYGMSTRTLAARNHMQPTDMLRAGRKLSLRPGSTPTVASTSARDGGSHTTYTVVRGDTLTHIAKRFSVSVAQLLSWNGLSRSTRLMPGQRLTVRPG